MSFRAIVFDLAGVLLDCEDAHENAARRAAFELQLTVPESWWARIRGGAYEGFFEQVFALPGNAARRLRAVETVLLAYDFYLEEVRRSARLMPDALHVLQVSRATFGLVALATSSEWRLAETALCHFGIGGYFDGVVSGDHVTQKKPAPEAILVTAWLLGVRPNSMIVVEDSVHGIRAARLARSHAIGVATNRDPQALRLADAHCVVRDHAELIEYLGRLARAGSIASPSL